MIVAYPVAAFALLLSMLYLIAKPLLGQEVPGVPERLRGDREPDTAGPGGPAAITADAVERRIAERKQALGRSRCAGCGHACDDGDRFCRSCGARLEVTR